MIDEAASGFAETLLDSHSGLAAAKEADGPSLLLLRHFQVLEDVLGITTLFSNVNGRISRDEKLIRNIP